MVLTLPKFLALDSSHLGSLIRDRCSDDAARKDAAEGFERRLQECGYILLLSIHHLLELLGHADDEVTSARARYLRTLPTAAWIKPCDLMSDGLGSVVDITAGEIKAALALGQASTETIARAAKQHIIKFGSGSTAMGEYDAILPQMKALAREQSDRHREVVAVTRADMGHDPHVKLSDLLTRRARSLQEINDFFGPYAERLSSEVVNRGDRRITDPLEVARRHMELIRSAADENVGVPVHPVVQILVAQGIRSSDIDADTTVGDVLDLVEFRSKAGTAAGAAGLRWSDVEERVDVLRLPSAIIQASIVKHRDDPKERKGSEQHDVYLACISPYADLTSVDKRTAANIDRARSKSKAFSGVMGRVVSATTYLDVVPHL